MQHQDNCDYPHLVVVYKNTGKTVPQRLYKYFVDHPEEAKEECEILCRNCQAFKISEMKEFQRNNK